MSSSHQLIPEFPEATRETAIRLLVKLEQQGHTDFGGQPLTQDLACQILTKKLDELLTPAGIPTPDSLTEGDASTTSSRPTVEHSWVTQTSRPEIRNLPPIACRSLRAGHIARDFPALMCPFVHTACTFSTIRRFTRFPRRPLFTNAYRLKQLQKR